MDNEKVLNFSEKINSVQFLYSDDDVSIVSLDLFHIDEDGESNRNKTNISLKTAKASLKTFQAKPIIFKFNKDKTDVSDHAHSKEDEYEMMVAGSIPSDSKITFIKRENGKTYCNCEAVLYKVYVPRLMEILANKDGNNRVSIEILARGKQDKDSGIYIVDYFKLRAVCLLGENVIEGIENSHLEIARFSKEYSSLNTKYIAFSANKKTVEVENIYQEIKNRKQEAKNNVANLTIETLKERLYKQFSQYKYQDGEWQLCRYWYVDIIAENNEVIVFDRMEDCFCAIPYQVSESGDVSIDIEKKEKVEQDVTYRKLYNALVEKIRKDFSIEEHIENNSNQANNFEAENTALKEQIANMASQHEELNAKFSESQVKCDGLKAQCDELTQKVQKYEVQDNSKTMMEYLNRFRNVLDDSDVEVIASKLEKFELEEYGDFESFKKMINEKIVNKVALQVNSDGNKQINNSKIMFAWKETEVTDSNPNSFDEQCKKYKVKR